MALRASRLAMVAAALLTQACTGGTMAVAPSAPGPAGTPSDPSYGIYGFDDYFKLEWQADERRGKPLVSGYVGNQWGFPVRNVRLRVEALDAAGNVTATYIGYVNGTVIPGSRVYFEVPVPAKAPRSGSGCSRSTRSRVMVHSDVSKENLHEVAHHARQCDGTRHRRCRPVFGRARRGRRRHRRHVVSSITSMTPVRQFYLDNLRGDLAATVAAANSAKGAIYPPGSVIQLIPGRPW